MSETELEKLAFAGAPTPELPYDLTLYYLMLRAMCDHGKFENFTPEQWKREKARITEAVRGYRSDRQLGAYHARINNELSGSTAKYRIARNAMKKSQSAEDTEKLIAEAIQAADTIVGTLDNIPI